MGDSIFEFGDKFGYKSPFGNWLNQKLESTANIESINIAQSYTTITPFSTNKVAKVISNKFSVTVTVKGVFDQVYVEVGNRKQTAYKSSSNYGEYITTFENLISPPYQFQNLTFKATITDLYSKKIIDTSEITARVDLNGTVTLAKPTVKKNDDEANNTESQITSDKYAVCAIDPKIRSHFVLHCTAGDMSLAAIKKLTNYDDSKGRSRSKSHVFLMKDGTNLQIWPFSEKNVWATKAESLNNLKGRMFHVEINYGAPIVPSEEQYQGLADLYIEAAGVEKCWPIIVPHIEIDRGIKDGHSDPTDFNYNHFYEILKNKNVPIDTIPKFSHDRYWGKPSYKVPWGSDKNSWPPILEGDPHKK